MGEIVRLKAADDHEFSAYHVAAAGDRDVAVAWLLFRKYLE